MTGKFPYLIAAFGIALCTLLRKRSHFLTCVKLCNRSNLDATLNAKDKVQLTSGMTQNGMIAPWQRKAFALSSLELFRFLELHLIKPNQTKGTLLIISYSEDITDCTAATGSHARKVASELL